jgi:wyosine [tRNA(Phe)-imidazoG37] synthetase (radical SAM superfamily)
MATFLFNDIVFGPVHSRRLGVSLGINLLPANSKVCSFDCIYCECGRNPESRHGKTALPARSEVAEKLKKTLLSMQEEDALPDVITFAGNGEPTLHPDFAEIIEDTLLLRYQLAPKARIAVLSNASMLGKKKVFKALLKVEDNIQKLDSAFEETLRIMDCPAKNFILRRVVDQLTAFNGKVIIQTMFLKGRYKNQHFDNTTSVEVEAWINLLKKIKPSQVMIYTIARDTPVHTLEKISETELNRIALQVQNEGFSVQVSA